LFDALPVNPVRASLIALLCGLCLSACGFRLAGTGGMAASAELPAQLASIYLQTRNLNAVQLKALELSLTKAGAEVVAQAESATAWLAVTLNELPDQQLATGGSGVDVVTRITRSLDFEVKAADGKIISPRRSLRQQTDVTLNENTLLAANRERKDVTGELEQALYDQLVRQLARISDQVPAEDVAKPAVVTPHVGNR
jgi:outer membrane lipopolysaccharide assembly protein LptE/RlpB